ncbi:MAG: FUSC family protein [Actinomycetota bacterium]|nr:FUSC family protein [Actinomycetota bacterium]
MARTDSPTRVAASSLRRLYADAARIDLSQSDPIVAARNAVGLIVPLVVGAALGSPAVGVQAAVGGLQTAFADRPGPYRLRVARMLITALAAALTAGLAAGFGHNLVASAVLLAVLAFASGQLLSVGPSAAQVGIAATACALVLGHIPERPLAALYTGLLVLAGGVLQTLFAIAAWPLGRHRPERQALAALYRQLATLAETPIDTSTSPPLGQAIADANAVLRGAGHDHGPSVEAYRVLLDEAVRARQDILVLSGYADRLRRDELPGPEALLRGELGAAAAVLSMIAEVLQSSRPIERSAAVELLRPVGDSVARLGDSLTERAAVNRLRSLAGQLRAMVETARTGAGEGRTDEDEGQRPGGLRLRDPIAVLRANFDLRSPALRHSSRLAILVPLTDVATRAAGIERGYWVSLTILVVLRPDFGSTFQRSLMRVLGTLVGLLLASVLVHFVFGGYTPALIVLLGLCFFGMRLAGPTNLGLAAVCLAGLVVVLLALAGFPAHTTVVDRSIDTAVGGAIALLAALAWPSWERQQVSDRLAELIGAYRGYLRAIIDPDSTAAQRSQARSQARLARSAAEASVDRVRAEPVNPRGNAELGGAVLAHTHRLVHALTAIDATRQGREVYQKVPEFRILIEAVLHGLGLVEQALDHGWVQIRELKLRPLQAEFAGALATAGLSPELAASLIEATDRLVNSLDSVAAVLTTPNP